MKTRISRADITQICMRISWEYNHSELWLIYLSVLEIKFNDALLCIIIFIILHITPNKNFRNPKSYIRCNFLTSLRQASANKRNEQLGSMSVTEANCLFVFVHARLLRSGSRKNYLEIYCNNEFNRAGNVSKLYHFYNINGDCRACTDINKIRFINSEIALQK